MVEQDAVHIGYQADVTPHLLDSDGKNIEVTGVLDTVAVVSVMPIKTWERIGFTREDLIPTKLRPRSNLCGRENSNKSPPHGWTEPLDEFPRGGEPGQFGSVHFGARLCQGFRRDDRP